MPIAEGRFDHTVHALVDTLARQQQAVGDITGHIESTARFVLATHRAMPDYLRVGLRLLTLVFGVWPYPLKARSFHALNLADRAAQVAAWEASRLPPRRALMQFYRSFTIFGLYSELYQGDYDLSLRLAA